MIQRGDYLAPYYFDEYRFNKPILTYWLVAGAYTVFGVSMWSGRIPFLLVAVATLWITWLISLELGASREAAFTAVLLLSASTMFSGFARIAMTDPLLTFFMTLSLWAYLKMLHNPSAALQWSMAGALFCSLAFVSKGPAAFYITAALVVYIVYAKRGTWLRWIWLSINPLTILILCLVVLPWYVYVRTGYPDVLARNIAHESGAASFSVGASLVRLAFYCGVLIVFALPFSIGALVELRNKPCRRLRGYGLLSAFIVITVLIFSLFIAGKKERYLCVLFPSLSILMAHVFSGKYLRRWAIIAIVVFFLHALVYVSYPIFSHEALRELVYWKQNNIAGQMGLDLDRMRYGWSRLYAGDKGIADKASARYILTSEERKEHYPGWPVLRQARRQKSHRFKNGRFQMEWKTYYLLERPG